MNAQFCELDSDKLVLQYNSAKSACKIHNQNWIGFKLMNIWEVSHLDFIIEDEMSFETVDQNTKHKTIQSL